MQSLSDLKAAPAAVQEAPKREKKVDAQGRSYATGKAQGRHCPCLDQASTGIVTVNDRPIDVYFARPVLRMILRQPLEVASRIDQYDITVTVSGGGLSGQAGAVRHGLSQALTITSLNCAASSRRKAS